MAELAVSYVIHRLKHLLIQKAELLKGVEIQQVEQLCNELVSILCFLKDADQKQDEDERIRIWVSEIRSAAYDFDYLIETHIQEIESHKNPARFLEKLVHNVKKVVNLGSSIDSMESIRRRIRNVAARRENLGLKNLGEAEEEEELPRLPFKAVGLGLGLGEKTRFLVSQLLNEEKRRNVVSIIGVDGIGKTTLARKVYSDPEVAARFDHSAWICISHKYSYKDVLTRIIKQVKALTEDLLCMMMEQVQPLDLELMLFQELKDKRYLIFIDDIWKLEEANLGRLLRAFPDGDKSSRLLITSYNQEIPLRADPLSVPFELKPLDPEDSWQLLHRSVDLESHQLDSESLVELEGVGREIARKCDGVALALKLVAGKLTRKKTLNQWKRVLKSINKYFSLGQTGVSGILHLSYNDLPTTNVKSCFLYMGFFPEDFEFGTRKLFQQWIAEGLVQQKGTKSLEDDAADILDELISRNMVEVVSWSADETPRSCRTHDLLRKLAITKAAEETFLEIKGMRYYAQFSPEARHLAVYSHSESLPSQHQISGSATAHHARSLLFFKTDPVGEVGLDFTCFKLLRVLDLENMKISHLPEEIGELCFLTFLCLRMTKIKNLPSSLGHLKSLQTLDIRSSEVVQVPDIIWLLENLRNLYMDVLNLKSPLKIDTLRNLRTLQIIEYRNLMHNNLLMLTSLQKLGIWIQQGSDIDKLLSSIVDLKNLKSLALFNVGNSFSNNFLGLSKLCHVTKLKLAGDLKTLPSPHHFPPNLSYLYLQYSELREDPMPILEKLEGLVVLKLRNAYKGRQIEIREGSFPCLEHFAICDLHNLEDVIVEKGAMPELKCFRIINCYSLKVIPEELNCRTSLQKLEVLYI